MPPSPPTTLAERLAERIATRDVPPPPPPLSQEPLAVEARVQAWLRATHGLRNSLGERSLSRMLLALADAPDCDTAQLAQAAGIGLRRAARLVVRLTDLGLLDSDYRGRTRYHRLLPAAEDALLLVVAGPAAVMAPEA